jgi:phospholipid/cholesterol/gamma-HCH transport system substrate-binding protein
MQQITPEGPAGPPTHQVLVVLSIENRYANIPINSQIRLVTRGLGSSYIEIQPPAIVGPGPFLSQGVRVQGTVVSGGDLLPESLQQRLDSLAQDISTLVGNLNAVVGDPNTQRELRNTIANMSIASGRLISTVDTINNTLAQVQEAVDQYKALASAGREGLTNLDQRTERLAATLIQTTEELGRAAAQVRQILAKVNHEQGTVGRLINDATLYEELLETATQFQAMTEELTKILQRLEQKGLSGIWRGSKAK